MVVGHDVPLSKVEGLMVNALVGRFMGKFVKSKTLKGWLLEHWMPLLGYFPTFHVLMRGWISFCSKE
jgi:hypothetical protein